MTTTSSTHTTGASGRLDEARRRVEASRRELTDTVQALAAKADVKSRAKEKLAETREQVTEKTGQQDIPPPALAAGGAFVLLLLLRRRRRRRRRLAQQA